MNIDPSKPDNSDVAAAVKQCADQLLRSMSFFDLEIECQIKEASKDNDPRCHIIINIEAGDVGKILIGSRGNNLNALRHVLCSVVRRQVDALVHVTVDVNNYLAARERSLFNQAEEGARKAVRTGQAVVLPPMNAANRRLIHSCLASRQEIHTESLGEEPNRRVIIRPTFI